MVCIVAELAIARRRARMKRRVAAVVSTTTHAAATLQKQLSRQISRVMSRDNVEEANEPLKDGDLHNLHNVSAMPVEAEMSVKEVC